MGVVPPGYDGPVTLHSQAVIIARGDRHDIGQTKRHIRLTDIVAVRIGVFSPGNYGAVRSQRKAVASAGGHGDHVVETSGNFRLAMAVIAPGDHGAVASQRKAVPGSCGEGDCICEVCGRVSLLIIICAPTHNGLIGPECQTMITAGYNSDYVCEARRHVALAVDVVPPGDDPPALEQAEAVPRTSGNTDKVGRRGSDRGLSPAIVARRSQRPNQQRSI